MIKKYYVDWSVEGIVSNWGKVLGRCNMAVGQEYVPKISTLVNGNMDQTCGPMVV